MLSLAWQPFVLLVVLVLEQELLLVLLVPWLLWSDLYLELVLEHLMGVVLEAEVVHLVFVPLAVVGLLFQKAGLCL